MKFILCGCGQWGKNYLNTINKMGNCSIEAIVTRNFINYNKPHYKDLNEALKLECNAIIIATHPDSHFEFAKLALENGKHVICEKPCMFSDKEFEIIEKLTSKNNLVFFTNYINIFQPVCEDIKNNLIGRNQLKICNVGNGPIRENYSALWDYGCHIISLSTYLFGHYRGITNIKMNDIGNYEILLDNDYGSTFAEFGNKSSNRIYNIEFQGEKKIIWNDNKQSQPLKIMLEKFINKKLITNIDMSIKISNILKECENKL